MDFTILTNAAFFLLDIRPFNLVCYNHIAMAGTTNIYDYDFSDLEQLITSWDQPAYRAEQVWRGLYRNFYESPSQFLSLPLGIRNRLADEFTSANSIGKSSFSRLDPVAVQKSTDGETIKTLFQLPDIGNQRKGLIEAVYMRYDRRRTLCISSQAGCAMGCVFCATGQMGFTRHLTSGEIVEQVLYYARSLLSENQTVTNIVVMGMGEPFHNYENTLQAIDRLNDARGMDLGARRFTISTVGLVPMIRRFADEQRQINLAISLHASEDAVRQEMLPVNKKYPISELMDACKYYILKTRRRLTFEWALINGVNDSVEEARRLGYLLNQLRTPDGTLLVHVNAIPLNPTRQYDGQASSKQRASEFKATLEKMGIPCTVRVRRGIDIQAGCGQLAGANAES